MRAEEFTTEMAGSVHGDIRKELMNRGYQYLGGGIDKHVFREPETGLAYIVFGYRQGHEGFSPDQLMFRDWINYCNQHRDNSHLPKFSGLESFKFRGKTYLQARMELLTEVSGKVKTIVNYLEDVTGDRLDRDVESALKKLTAKGYWDDEAKTLGYFTMEEVIDSLGGMENAANLLNTINEVRKFGQEHGFSLDLHSGNYMKRTNGTIVVNDPFVLWLQSR